MAVLVDGQKALDGTAHQDNERIKNNTTRDNIVLSLFLHVNDDCRRDGGNVLGDWSTVRKEDGCSILQVDEESKDGIILLLLLVCRLLQ